jgi:hypothetical protein
MLSVIWLDVGMLSVIMLVVVMLSVVAPLKLHRRHCNHNFINKTIRARLSVSYFILTSENIVELELI